MFQLQGLDHLQSQIQQLCKTFDIMAFQDFSAVLLANKQLLPWKIQNNVLGRLTPYELQAINRRIKCSGLPGPA